VSDTSQQARERYLQRIEIYKSFGYDRPAAVRYAVDRLEPFEGTVLDVGTGQGLLAIELARRRDGLTPPLSISRGGCVLAAQSRPALGSASGRCRGAR
jgi:SAM-dependent methyltransferase